MPSKLPAMWWCDNWALLVFLGRGVESSDIDGKPDLSVANGPQILVLLNLWLLCADTGSLQWNLWIPYWNSRLPEKEKTLYVNNKTEEWPMKITSRRLQGEEGKEWGSWRGWLRREMNRGIYKDLIYNHSPMRPIEQKLCFKFRSMKMRYRNF